MHHVCCLCCDFFLSLFFFFFNDPATTEIYTLSLHDALPIFGGGALLAGAAIFALDAHDAQTTVSDTYKRGGKWEDIRDARSEEHTSELQSHVNLVCRLLLEKKKKKQKHTKTQHTHHLAHNTS